MTEPTLCSTGSYQPSCGAINCNPCDSGYYCNQTGLTQIIGKCPIGNMCPLGTSSPTPCSTGTYNNVEGQPSCIGCPIGYYCPSQAMTAPTLCNSGYICNVMNLAAQIPCPSGYFCPNGTNTSDTTPGCSNCPQLCPAGYRCPLASFTKTLCEAGYYQNLTGQSSCKICEIGYYCPSTNTVNMTVCDAGSYCNIPGSAVTSGLCPAGYFCLAGTASAVSTYKTNRRLSVFYCDRANILKFFKGTLPKEPIPCEPGTYCPSGTASDVVGSQTGPQQCEKGYYSSICGSEECTECNSGYYCDQVGTVNPILCPSGTYRSGVAVLTCQNCPAGT